MKIRIPLFLTIALFTVTNSLYAQGTAFTYQGHLNDGVNPASGSYDLNRKVETQNTKLQELSRKVDAQNSENAELKQRLEALEKIIRHQKSN